jgi:radial spoke head protein 9
MGKSTSDDLVPSKHFFWCSSTNFIFSSLPKPTQSVCEKLRTFPSLFTGEFDQVLVQSTEPAKVIDAAAGIVLPPKHMTELDRLSVVVNQIDRRCTAVPKGCVKYTPSHAIVYNEAFRGLSVEKAMDLSNWQHLRAVECEEKKDLIARHEAIYNENFLDELKGDMPHKCWSVLSDVTKTVAVVRSQLWPGYYAYHRCNTNVHGGIYIGDGLRCNDLPFML